MATANVLGRTGNTKALLETTSAKSTSALSGATMDQDMFLQLLVQQMSNQDPLEPMSNEDMLAQLAQFTSLEQMTNLNDSFGLLAQNMDQLNFISASSMIGRDVSGFNADGDLIQGTVDAVNLEGSIVQLRIGDEWISMAGIQSIE